MRLSDILSKSLSDNYCQVENFFDYKRLTSGVQRRIDIGTIALNFCCKKCQDTRTFVSMSKIYCIGINDNMISIDCSIECPICNTKIPMWFLVESKDKMYIGHPEVRIVKLDAKLPNEVSYVNSIYGEYTQLLEKAECAYKSGLGAGSIVYLRKIFENITVKAANSVNIATKGSNGKPIPFRNLLEAVDKECGIVPKEFSENGYKLFGELSDVVHGEYDEELGVEKYPLLKRLVIGILDNIKNRQELEETQRELGWKNKEEVCV